MLADDGSVSMYAGEHRVAIEQLERALRHNPDGQDTYHIAQTMSAAHYFLGEYAAALRWANATLTQLPNAPIALQLAAASKALTGDAAGARELIDLVRAVFPTMTASSLTDLHPFKRTEDRARWDEGLRGAGLME